MNYNILHFDSSNIKILNDIETISGIFKVNGIDKFEETSNSIILTSNNISDRITNLNADDIADGTENKYIINNIYSDDLTVSGDFTINDADKNTTIKSVLYSSNYVEIINHSSNTAFTIKQYNDINDVFSVLNTTEEVFSIINNGNVGIGTYPMKKLDVDGDINFTGKLYNGSSEFINSYMLKNGDDILFTSNIKISGDLTTEKLELNNTDGHSDIFIASNTSKEVFSIINNGNVGIGITNPDYSLHVEGNDGILIPAGETSNRPDAGILKKGVIRYNTDLDRFEGFGTGDKWGALSGVKDDNGDTYISAENNPGDNNDELKFFTSNLERMVINKSGNVDIGKTNQAVILHVFGEIIATNKITSFYSDERLKTDIELIPDPLNIIEQLNGFYYKPNKLANSFGIESNHRELGLSAQEVNKVLPELVDLAPLDIMHDKNNNIVSKSGENYLTLSYDKMIPVIIESIKKLNSEIKLLKEENKLLKESIKKNS